MIRLRPASCPVGDKTNRSRAFLGDKGGNVSLMFALLLIPMIGSVGLAVDFGHALTARNKAQVAADAAALQAAGVARDLIQKGDGSASATTAALAEAKARAKSLFGAYATQYGLTGYTFDADVKRTGQEITAGATYSLATDNFIGRMFGQTTFTSSGDARSSSSLPTYADVYLALDLSQSMGIAATDADMTRLFNAKAKMADGSMKATSCVFGCHAIERDYAESYMDVAERNGIELRIDVLRDAVKTMLTTAESDAGSAATYQFALYGMWMNTSTKKAALQTLSALSNKYSTLQTAADGITLGPSAGNSYSDSYLNENMATFSGLLPAAGDGSSQSSARKFAFVVTDGVRDVMSGNGCVQTGNRCVSALAGTSCEDMKKRGITVGVLYTTYVPPRPYVGNDWYQIQVVNTGVAANIASSLKACASDGWFYEAADASGINNAMKAMFEQITSTPALVN